MQKQMIPFSKVNIEDLVGKDLIFTNLNGWEKKGTVWTPNKYDYGFIFKGVEQSIKYTSLSNINVRFIKNNHFYLPISKTAFLFYYPSDNQIYKELSDILENVQPL